MIDMSRRARKVLSAVWLLLVGLLVLAGLNFLVVLKTGDPLLSLAGMLGVPLPETLQYSPWTHFLLSGEIHPGYFGTSEHAPAAVLLFLTFLTLVLVGGWILYRRMRQAATGGAPGGAGAPAISRWICIAGMGLLTAGIIAFLLEVLGLWTRLPLRPDPYQETGAPFWMWWITASVAAILWYFALRRLSGGRNAPLSWVRRLSALALISILLIAMSLVFHVGRPEPVQGRYYRIPGFVVGRAQNYEYGTYYGMIAGTGVLMLTTAQIAILLVMAQSRTRHE